MAGESAVEITKRWLSLVVLGVGLCSGFLSWFASFVLQGARISALETGVAAHFADYQKTQDKRDVQIDAISVRLNIQEINSVRTQDGLAELKGMIQHLDGRLSGVTTAKGRQY